MQTNPYEGLRAMALRTRPGDIGLSLPEAETTAFGVVMDIGLEKAVATLTGFRTGDASLYLSTGGGVIGGRAHLAVRDASTAWVFHAQGRLDLFAATTEHPTPPNGTTIFYVLTNHGVLAATAPTDELDSGRTPLSPVWKAGQAVLTQLRLTSEKSRG